MNDINAAQRSALRHRRPLRQTASSASPRRLPRLMIKGGRGHAQPAQGHAHWVSKIRSNHQETGVGNDEGANQLFMFTQWSEMMTEFARTGKTSTVVLPSDFFAVGLPCSSRCWLPVRFRTSRCE